MWPNPQETANLVTFTEEILNRKLHFLCSEYGRCRSAEVQLQMNTVILKHLKKCHVKDYSKIFMLMMMMMNCFCGVVDRRKALSLISSRDHCQRSSPSRISDTPRAGFEPAQNLSSGLVEWSCAVVITTTPRRHGAF